MFNPVSVSKKSQKDDKLDAVQRSGFYQIQQDRYEKNLTIWY